MEWTEVCAFTTFHQLGGFYQLVNESFTPVTDWAPCTCTLVCAVRKAHTLVRPEAAPIWGLPRLTGFDENQLCSAC